MATQHSRSAARLMMAPAVTLLLGWMLIPLSMTLFFSFRQYLPLRPDRPQEWVGFDNYVRFVTSSAFWPSVQATLVIVGGVLLITVVIQIQTIFLLGIFAEILETTQGAFGSRTLTYLIYQRVLESQNVGLGSAGGVYAIILANIVAIFLLRIVGKNLDA